MAKSRRKQQPQRSPQRASAAPPPAVAAVASAEPEAVAEPASRATPAVPPPSADPRAGERIARQQERAAARRRQERQRQIRRALIGLAAVLLIGGGLAWWIVATDPFAPSPGRTVPIASRQHIPDGQKATDFTSVPPTSGQHYGSTAREGVHTEPIADELQVHNLEHGQIMVQYTCTDCPELADQLKGFAARYPKWVIVAPYPNPEVGARIVLTAWGRIDTFDEYDEARIDKFISKNRNNGPEKVIRE